MSVYSINFISEPITVHSIIISIRDILLPIVFQGVPFVEGNGMSSLYKLQVKIVINYVYVSMTLSLIMSSEKNVPVVQLCTTYIVRNPQSSN